MTFIELLRILLFLGFSAHLVNSNSVLWNLLNTEYGISAPQEVCVSSQKMSQSELELGLAGVFQPQESRYHFFCRQWIHPRCYHSHPLTLDFTFLVQRNLSVVSRHHHQIQLLLLEQASCGICLRVNTTSTGMILG